MKQEIRREIFERIRQLYSKPAFIETDPLRYVQRFEKPEDREVAAILSSLFAYGRVTAIFGFLDRLFSGLGKSPADTLAGTAPLRTGGYRFQTATDAHVFLSLLRSRIRERGFPLFDFPAEPEEDAYGAIDRLARELLESLPARLRTPGILFLIGRPGSSPAKRLCLFYRWMVRKSFPDSGLYRAMTPRQLIIPMDTHILRIARWTGLSERRTPDRKTAREITEGLRRLHPRDPLIYDFALTRPGILRDREMLALFKSMSKPIPRTSNESPAES